ncbi:MAG: succinate dehydrogenase/fumarate reductase flavoprotein subunit, partial [Chloroflexota bacterium]|jgi:succinate dehydrogenase / fumarate reductase flavoprotein subunit
LFPLPDKPAEEVITEIEAIRNGKGGIKAFQLRQEMQQSMTKNVGVFRTEETLKKGLDDIKSIRSRFTDVEIDDKGMVFNTDLLETWELGCLLELAEVTTVSALARTESRGAHARDDYKKRNDDEWLKHTLCFKEGDSYRLDYKPVTLGRYEPKPRAY